MTTGLLDLSATLGCEAIAVFNDLHQRLPNVIPNGQFGICQHCTDVSSCRKSGKIRW
jgi:hypothetical protein